MSSTSGRLQLHGLSGSAAALVLYEAQQACGLSAVYILRDADEAGYFYNDLLQAGDERHIFYLPSSYKKKVQADAPKDASNLVLRTEALSRLKRTRGWTLVTSPEAFAERVVTQAELENETLFLKQNQHITMEEVESNLRKYKFNQVDFVYEPGQYAVRGSLIDVFSYSSDLPYRIDFWGDEIDSLRTFDIANQTSIASQEEISIVSNAVQTARAEELSDIFDFFPKNCLLAFLDGRTTLDTIAALHQADNGGGLFLAPESLTAALEHFRTLDWGNHPIAESRRRIDFDESLQPVFHKNFDLTADDFAKRLAIGYEVMVLSDNPKQTDRLRDIFAERLEQTPFTAVSGVLHEGFIDHDLKICVYTDHQIFDRFHKYQLKSTKTRAGKVVMSLKELMQIQVGDYIVHTDHGVGRFGGLVRMNVGGHMQELIKLTFRDDDILFVNIHSLHRISKYKGREGEPPRMNKLGTAAWNNLKEKTKKKVKDIARELIALYARRRQEQGFRFSPDSYLQEELESSFLYEDTPDQSKATLAVKQDMESAKPMDRLICGDVGFGKTEVAMRAAFKAVTDNKQVAVLVPTTVLAFQHYKSFTRRLKRFPCKVDYLSRARTASEVKEIKEQLASGGIDILIGTHKILSKDIRFKDLGLLIIDEEQKFGVSAKEKLRQMRVNIDTLTLTATPIPRTLQFSLMGARDLSVISTPPPNRYPVQTELIGLDADTIQEAIEFELARGGQVFFVNNRISNLPELEAFLHRLVPKARIAVGHGQMEGEKLESVILDFIDHEYDILLATSIIESGIDIPNVNTMFINNAQNFGLSDLHQLRGRVGRTNKKAFCYLISPPLASLPADSRRRLQAIENFADLGSGIHIAMQDLDIRGAGNILGGEQSGFISDLGYETYHRILDEAVYELKHDEFKELFEQENRQELESYTTECAFESDQELLLPADYVENVAERMELYRRLDGIKEETTLQAFEKELEDRFGPLPETARDLIAVVRLRWLAMQLGIEKLTLKQQRLTAYFVSVEHQAFYQSDHFGRILNYIASHPGESHMSPQGEKPSCWFKGVGSVRAAIDLVKQF
ncbi:MAG: transcription-repair coupling factor [Paludibacteraceae bacterium]|nr:transcription-repair coupling factor [Paludibacteraceae bacterium]